MATDDDRYDPNRPLTPRELVMAQIDKDNEARRVGQNPDLADQLDLQGVQTTTHAGVQPPAPAPAPAPSDPMQAAKDLVAAPAAPAAGPAAPAAAPVSTLDPQLLEALGKGPVALEALDNLVFTTKVDGKDVTRTLKEFRRTVQLDGAAQSRFDQANRVLTEANALLQRVQSGAVPPPAPGPDSPVGVEGKPPGSDSPPATAETVSKIVNAIYLGDSDSASALLTSILEPILNRPAPLDQAEVVRQVVPAVTLQLSKEEAEGKFRSEYADVLKDPTLVAIAEEQFAQIAAEDPHKPFAEVLLEAGAATRKWVESIKGATAPAPSPEPTPMDKRRQAKAAIDNVGGGLSARAPSQPAERVETVHETIESMRKSRGLS